MKQAFSIFFLLGLILSTGFAADETSVGFSQGNRFYSSHLQGTVTVYCESGETVTYTCNDTVLDPSSYDYFVGPQGVKAEEVSLTSTRADGSRRERTESYNSKTPRSMSAFNLWISTPFQRPLLGLGSNKIDYRLKSAGKTVDQGAFSVSVTYGGPRTCPATHYNSNDASDCQSPYTICQKYFEQYDHCR
ncbi:MAG TPA: hypothetical protein VIG33_10270 [Pseudobdellovibrionaceae bacterium]|jgi:hypothetical protein